MRVRFERSLIFTKFPGRLIHTVTHAWKPHKNGLVTLAPFLLHERKVFSVERFWPFQKARTCSMNSITSVSLKILLILKILQIEPGFQRSDAILDSPRFLGESTQLFSARVWQVHSCTGNETGDEKYVKYVAQCVVWLYHTGTSYFFLHTWTSLSLCRFAVFWNTYGDYGRDWSTNLYAT